MQKVEANQILKLIDKINIILTTSNFVCLKHEERRRIDLLLSLNLPRRQQDSSRTLHLITYYNIVKKKKKKEKSESSWRFEVSSRKSWERF